MSDVQQTTGLFAALPDDPAPLRPDAAALLAALPVLPVKQEVSDDQHGAARYLEARKLVQIAREKMDPIAHRPTWFAGRMQ